MSKKGGKMARAYCAMWHGRTTMPQGDRATWHDRASPSSGAGFSGG